MYSSCLNSLLPFAMSGFTPFSCLYPYLKKNLYINLPFPFGFHGKVLPLSEHPSLLSFLHFKKWLRRNILLFCHYFPSFLKHFFLYPFPFSLLSTFSSTYVSCNDGHVQDFFPCFEMFRACLAPRLSCLFPIPSRFKLV